MHERRADHRRSYGTHTNRRTETPRAILVELRRGRVPTRATTPYGIEAGLSGSCDKSQARYALVATTLVVWSPSAPSLRALRHARHLHLGSSQWWRCGLQH